MFGKNEDVLMFKKITNNKSQNNKAINYTRNNAG